MAKENWQKIKLLKLYELLKQESDDQHPLTTNQICSKMVSLDIPCDRRTLSKDVQILNNWGIEVLCKSVGKEKGYYILDRSFSIPEIKILMDAIQSVGFITDSKTKQLTMKLAQLAGSHMADVLEENMVYFNTKKHTNESIYYNVDFIERALQEKKKISFKYFDLNEWGHRVFRKDGQDYIVEPIALIFQEDNYYLIVYNEKYETTNHYRVDRMYCVEILEECVSNETIELKKEVSEYVDSVFKMYGGPLVSIELQFDRDLMGVIYDKFGEDVSITPMNTKFITSVDVQLSPTFWGWLFQFGNKIQILSPNSVIEEYKNKIREMGEYYGGIRK